MTDNYDLTDADTTAARLAISGYKPRWCAATPEVSFMDVVKAKAGGDLHQLSLVSLSLALRSVDLDRDSFAIVPGPIKNVPAKAAVTRLLATSNREGQVERSHVYVLVGVTLEQAKRLGGRGGLLWMVWVTQGRVWLVRGEQREDLGHHEHEILLKGLAKALQVVSVELVMLAETFTDALMASRFETTNPSPQTVP